MHQRSKKEVLTITATIPVFSQLNIALSETQTLGVIKLHQSKELKQEKAHGFNPTKRYVCA